jgi:hypothetical protein
LRDPGAAFSSSFSSLHIRVLTEFHSFILNTNADEFSYNTLLHCFLKESNQWASYADEILQEMKDRKVFIGQVSYHGMINIHAKNSSKDGAKKAETMNPSTTEDEGAASGRQRSVVRKKVDFEEAGRRTSRFNMNVYTGEYINVNP